MAQSLYLSGLEYFDVITDHQPLKSIFNRKDLFKMDNGKLPKIKQELQGKYIFTVDYRKGEFRGIMEGMKLVDIQIQSLQMNVAGCSKIEEAHFTHAFLVFMKKFLEYLLHRFLEPFTSYVVVRICLEINAPILVFVSL